MTRPTRTSPLLVAALLASGCGGDEAAERRQGENRARAAPRPGDHVTKREFTHAADRLCVTFKRRAAGLRRRRPRNVDELVGFARRIVKFSRDGLREFEELPLPSDARARAGAKRYLGSIRKFDDPLDRLESSAGALEDALDRQAEPAGREASLDLKRAATDLDRADRQANSIARAYGLKDCG